MFFTHISYHLTLLSTVISFNYGTFLYTKSIEHDWFIINLNGKSANQFQTVQNKLQELLAKLGISFCNSVGLKNCETISPSKVVIHSVAACPSDWPSSELCASVNFSVPVGPDEAGELTYKHLRTMWGTHTESQLTQIGLQEYEIPKNPTILIMWLGVTGLLIIIFIIIVIVVLKTKAIEKYIRRRRDILGSSNRSWLAKNGNNKQLVPPFLQAEPPLGTNENDTVYGLQVIQHSYGVENPGYDHGQSMKFPNERQITHGANEVDDFDSDDDTIYPPPPPLRPRDKNVITHNLEIENTGNRPETAPNLVKTIEKKMFDASSAVDDFDSDDDVIYPPAPPLRPQHKRNTASTSMKENETSF